jgi:predicted component of type VI protein secretion system
MTVSIEIEAGTQHLGKHFIGQKAVVVGRSQSADIVLPASLSAISSKHASIKEQGNVLYIIDGDGRKVSTNGVFLDGSRIAPGRWVGINEQSTITLGAPTMQGSVKITIERQASQHYSVPSSSSYSSSTQAPQAPVPVQLTNTGVNIALVRPERDRSRWKTPISLMTHLIGLGVILAILPSIMGSAFEAGIAIVVIIALEIYFLPSTVSFNRDQPNRFAILALNLFMGWTLIGWVVSLVWSLTAR